MIVGDSNMSEYATFLKVGTASILLRMLEDPSVVLRDMTLENPIRAIREISHDMTCKRKVRLANGREVSALDIQNEYLGRALRYAETKGFSDLEMLALEMWEHVLTQLEADPMKLDRHCDWVIKYKLIEAYRARNELPLAHPKVALMDLQYHDVNQERGLFYKLSAAGASSSGCAPTTRSPTPSTTRPRPPGRSCGASSSARPRSASGTTRSTGCT